MKKKKTAINRKRVGSCASKHCECKEPTGITWNRSFSKVIETWKAYLDGVHFMAIILYVSVSSLILHVIEDKFSSQLKKNFFRSPAGTNPCTVKDATINLITIRACRFNNIIIILSKYYRIR